MARKKDKGLGEGLGEGRRRAAQSLETTKALLIAVVIALTIRVFLVEPFKIPSGSMIPTLLVGDYIIVNKLSYGVRLPFNGQLLIPIGEPVRGDVVVFRFPDNPKVDYIKRVVGIPGDRLEIRRGRLFVNGQPVDRVPEGDFLYPDQNGGTVTSLRFREISDDGREYTVIQRKPPDTGSRGPWTVPEGSYFMMGDNRDNSNDSRRWRTHFVRSEQLKGRAVRIHWSWDLGGGPASQRGFIADFAHTLWRVVTFQVEEIRWGRIGRKVDGLAD